MKNEDTKITSVIRYAIGQISIDRDGTFYASFFGDKDGKLEVVVLSMKSAEDLLLVVGNNMDSCKETYLKELSDT